MMFCFARDQANLKISFLLVYRAINTLCLLLHEASVLLRPLKPYRNNNDFSMASLFLNQLRRYNI
jgi:hypothetical protein